MVKEIISGLLANLNPATVPYDRIAWYNSCCWIRNPLKSGGAGTRCDSKSLGVQDSGLRVHCVYLFGSIEESERWVSQSAWSILSSLFFLASPSFPLLDLRRQSFILLLDHHRLSFIPSLSHLSHWCSLSTRNCKPLNPTHPFPSRILTLSSSYNHKIQSHHSNQLKTTVTGIFLSLFCVGLPIAKIFYLSDSWKWYQNLAHSIIDPNQEVWIKNFL